MQGSKSSQTGPSNIVLYTEYKELNVRFKRSISMASSLRSISLASSFLCREVKQHELDKDMRGLTLRETNNDDFLEQDYNYGQSSQLGWVDNAGTSSNIPLSLNLDVADYYRASNNADGGECPYDSSSSDDGVRFNSRQRSMSISPYPKQESISQTSMQRPTSMSQSNNRPHFYSNEVLFLDHFQEAPDVFMDKHENNFIPTDQGCSFKLCATKDSSNNLWKIDKYIGEHTCNMGHCRGGHNNLDVDMIATVLVSYIEKTPRYPIKDCQMSILNKFRKIISRRKAFLGRKHAFEQVYGNWEASFCELPRFIAAMKHFKPGFVNEWRFERHEGVDEHVFNYVFWTFKPCTDGNGSIFSLAFAIAANKSFDTWTKFLSDLHQHVVCGRQAATATHAMQDKKFLLQMELIKGTHLPAYEWLMKLDLEKWTMHKDDGRRWSMLIMNNSKSFNGLLKYNFDPVNEKPLHGCYEWVKIDP
ncbi:hypothetical protein BC332_15397 [Capsicum chinense]|nr:hypothetical protein BC332_15397 [Capsicum chinense]